MIVFLIYRAGINFVSVHDCFWTHPGSVDLMNKVSYKIYELIFN